VPHQQSPNQGEPACHRAPTSSVSLFATTAHRSLWPNTALPFSSFLSFVIRSTTARFSELSHTFHCGENINQWVEFRLSMPLAL
jgi:hypothetical protein